MFLGQLLDNPKKVIKVLRTDGFFALVRILHNKIWTYLNWKRGDVFRLSILADNRTAGYYKIAIFTGLPLTYREGGNRAAEFTRAALRAGIEVLYVHVFQARNSKRHADYTPKIRLPNLIHKSIQDLTIVEFLQFVDENTTVIFELPLPQFVDYLDISRIRNVHTVFELTDDWKTRSDDGWFNTKILQEFILMAQVVIGTSQPTTDTLVRLGRSDALFLPAAANEYDYDRHVIYKRPPDLPDNPLALYIRTSIEDQHGWQYIQAAALKNPGIQFCIMGNEPVKNSRSVPPNIHFLDAKKYEEVPRYLSAIDFGLLPYEPGKNLAANSAMRACEYLFMAKPVVSTKLLELEGYPLVFAAKDENEFSDLCQEVKNISDEKKYQKIDDFIAHNSWCARLQPIINLEGEHNVSAVILIHNNRDIISYCLQSLIDHCSSYLADIVVVDNASTDGGGEFVQQEFPLVRLVKNPVNGCSSGRNLGVKSSSGKYLAFFDSDQWFSSGFCFAEALSILSMQAEIGAVGWAGGWFYLDRNDLEGPVVDFFPHRAMNANAKIKGYRTDLAYLGTGGLFIPRPVFEAIGEFDLTYDPTSFEDTDLSFSIKKLGFDLAYRDLTGIHHIGQKTTKSHEKSPEYREIFTKNSKYFRNKWAEYPHYYIEKNKWTL